MSATAVVDTVFPTVVEANASGRIVLCDQTDDYPVLPDPRTFAAALGLELEPASTRGAASRPNATVA